MKDHLTPEQKAAFASARRAVRGQQPKEPPPEVSAAFERGDEVELGQDLARRLGPAGDVVQAEDRVWQFNGATWSRWDDSNLKREAQSYAGRGVVVRRPDKDDYVRPLLLSNSNVKGIVQVCKDFLQQPDFFADAPVGIPFRSAFARIDGDSVVIEPLTRAHRVKQEHASPFDLPPSPARPATVDMLLEMAWGGCADYPERVRFFWEWLGAALAGISTRYKDTPILYGPKDTGKSQILHVVTSVFPVTSHRAVTLQNMALEHHRAHLSGGRINSVNELPARELMDGEAAKAILSGDVVSCRRMRENPFDWVPRCAHIFSTNALPPARDDALMDRFTLLDCLNVIPDDRKDRRLAEKISAEAPLVAACALEALPELLRRGRLIRPGSSAAQVHEWRTQSDPIHAWAHECVTQNPPGTASESSSDLYAEFKAWAQENGHAVPSIMKFSLRLKAMGFEQYKSSGMRWWATLLSAPRREAQSRWTGHSRHWQDR